MVEGVAEETEDGRAVEGDERVERKGEHMN